MSNRRYIKSIIAHNFMSCAHVEIDLVKGLNVVNGESDSGKTTLFKRATSWCLNNDLSGDEYVRDNDEGKVDKEGKLLKENECYVTLVFDNDAEITRKRVKGKNIYEVTTEMGEYFPFENFGNNVPDKVLEVSGMKKINIDKDLSISPNFPPKKELGVVFMNNGAKAKVVGSFGGTHIIDAAVREIQADMKKNTMYSSHLSKDLETLDNEISKLGDIDYKEKLISKCEMLFSEIDKINKDIETIKSLSDSIKEKELIIKDANKIIASKKYVQEEESRLKLLEEKLSKIRAFTNEYDNIVQHCKSIKEKEQIIKDCTFVIKNKQFITEEENYILKIEMKVNELALKNKELTLNRRELSVIKNNIEISQKVIKECDNIIMLGKDLDNRALKVSKLEDKISTIKNNTNELSNRINTLSTNKNNLFILKNNILRANKELEDKENILKLEKIILDKETKIANIKNNHSKMVEKIQELKQHQKIINECIDKEEKGVPVLNKMKNNLDIVINQYINNVKNMGKCPVCSSKLTPEHLANLKSELIS